MTGSQTRAVRGVQWGVAVVAALVAAVLPLGAAEAAETKTWVGGGGNVLWSNPANWSPSGAPANDDSIVLPAGSSSVFDITGLQVASISTLPGSPAATTSVGAGIVGPLGVTGNVSAQGDNLWLDPRVSFAAGGHDLATAGGTILFKGVLGDGDVRTTGPGHVEFESTTGLNGAIDVRSTSFYTSGLGSAAGGLTIAAGSYVTVADDGAPPILDAITVLDGPAPAVLEGIFTQLRGPIELQGDLQLLYGYSIGGTISGPGGLEIVSTGNHLSIDGANSYTGGTVVSRHVSVSGPSPFGTGDVRVTELGVLELRDGVMLGNDIEAPSTSSAHLGFLRVMGAATINGYLTITGDDIGWVGLSGNGSLRIAGGVQSSAALFLQQNAPPADRPTVLIEGFSTIPTLRAFSVDVILDTDPHPGFVGTTSATGSSVGPASITFMANDLHDPLTPIDAEEHAVIDLRGSDQSASSVVMLPASRLFLGTISNHVADVSRLEAGAFRLARGATAEWLISGTSNDQIVASPVTLNGDFSFYYQGLTPVGFSHVLIENTGTQPVQGTFGNAPEGSTWFGGQQMYELSYRGGNGNDVTLTRVGGLQSTWSYDEAVDHGGGMLGAPALSSWGHGRLDAWVVGLDRQLWHRWSQGGGGAWEPLGGTLLSTPAAVSQRPGEADVFARGADNALWVRRFRSGWGPWVKLGGILSEAPSVTSWAPGRIDIAARGADGAIWHGRMVNDVFQGWTSLGGFTSSAPSITDWGAGHLDVFARGGDRALWQKTFANGSWGGWVSHGGILTDGPATASSTFGELAVYARGVDGLLWHRSLEFFGWSEWTNLELPIHERPAVVGTDPGHMQLAVRSDTSSLWTWHVFQPWRVGGADASAADAGEAAHSGRYDGGAMGVRLVGPLPPAG